MLDRAGHGDHRLESAAERLVRAVDEAESVMAELRSLVEVTGTRLWTSSEFAQYLKLRRREIRSHREFAVALMRHEAARRRAWHNVGGSNLVGG